MTPVWNYDMPLAFFIWTWVTPFIGLAFGGWCVYRILGRANVSEGLGSAIGAGLGMTLSWVPVFVSYTIGGFIWGNWEAWL